jgi:hypothetical protein
MHIDVFGINNLIADRTRNHRVLTYIQKFSQKESFTVSIAHNRMEKYTPSVFIGELFIFKTSLGDLLELISWEESLLSTLDILDVPGLSPLPVTDISERFRFPRTDPGYCI